VGIANVVSSRTVAISRRRCAPARSLRTQSLYDSFHCRNRRCALVLRPHYAVAAWWRVRLCRAIPIC